MIKLLSTKIYVYNNFKQVNTSLSQTGPIDGTLTRTITPGQSGLESNGNEGLTSQTPMIHMPLFTATLRTTFVLEEFYLSAEDTVGVF